MIKRQLQKTGCYCLAVVLLVGVYLGIIIYKDINTPMPLHRNESIVFRMDESSSARTLAHVLQSQHLIRYPKLFVYFIRIKGFSKHLKAGVYQIKLGESANKLLQRVVSGAVLREKFSIIEGTTQKQVTNNLLHAAFLKYHDEDWQGIKGIKSQNEAEETKANNAEGLLLADTYQYNAGSEATTLLLQAHTALTNYLLNAWLHRDPNLPYKNPYELLIAASILEKETAIMIERRLISGVIVNRLNQHMPLQMDPTVIYGLGNDYTGKLTHENLSVDSLYNSYRYRGLPPTPIAMVGKEAIDAASHPTITDYLYFVAKGDGSHLFSATYQQQRKAIGKYLKNHDH